MSVQHLPTAGSHSHFAFEDFSNMLINTVHVNQKGLWTHIVPIIQPVKISDLIMCRGVKLQSAHPTV